MKLLITGGRGAVAQSLARRLLHHDIHVITRDHVDMENTVAVQHLVTQLRPDWIINCAARGRDQPRSLDLNIINANLSIYQSLQAVSHLVQGIIQFGSGAEFDVDRPIQRARESDIWIYMPPQSYGRSKNIISRMASMEPNIYTLRLWGFFDDHETATRPFARLASTLRQGQRFVVEQDRWFDWFSGRDLARVVDNVMAAPPSVHDVNLVYSSKSTFGDSLQMLCDVWQQPRERVEIRASNGLDYTGCSETLDNLGWDLLGLQGSLQHYRWDQQ